MKKSLCIVLAMLVVAPLFAFSETEKPERKNVVKINTLTLVLGMGSVYYERKINDVMSGQLGATYVNYKFGDNTKFSGLSVSPEVRFYFQNDAVDGVYAAPYARYQNFGLDNTETNDNASYSNVGGGLALGRQWITKSGFTMDLFFGGHYSSGKIEGASGDESFSTDLFEGFGIRAGFLLGFAF